MFFWWFLRQKFVTAASGLVAELKQLLTHNSKEIWKCMHFTISSSGSSCLVLSSSLLYCQVSKWHFSWVKAMILSMLLPTRVEIQWIRFIGSGSLDQIVNTQDEKYIRRLCLILLVDAERDKFFCISWNSWSIINPPDFQAFLWPFSAEAINVIVVHCRCTFV